jgi:glycosyltransferase involved in cell wall biosynthesis
MQSTDAPINVLYISYDGMTDPLGQSQVIPYLQGLSKLGYAFTLISFEKPERYEKNKASISALLQQSNIDWQPLPYTKRPPVLSTIWDLQKMKLKAVQLHRQKQFKIVHCRSYISAMVGMDMQKQFGVKFLFDMRGFYADERVEGGIWKLSNPLFKLVYKFFKKKEELFFSSVDYSVCLTKKGKDIIHTWKNIKNQPIHIEVIPCCADLDLFSEKSIDSSLLQQLKQQFNLTGNEFVLSYLGSVGTWYMLNEMLDFFKCLLRTKPNARFLFITSDTSVDILLKAKNKGIPEACFIITPAPHKQVPTYLALSNCSIFFIKPVFSKSASSPTKQGEIMGMGLSHICNAGVGDVDDIIDEKSGVLIKTLNNSEYEKAIQKLLNSNYDKDYIRQRAEQIYSLVVGVEKYRQIYEWISPDGS